MPSTYSIAKKCVSPTWSASKARTMFGWYSEAAAMISRRKRRTASGRLVSSLRMTLRATIRPMAAVPGLEDLAHAAFAEPFQQDVTAQHQLGPLAQDQLIDLEGRQPAALDQVLGQCLGIAELGRPRRELVHALRLQQAVQAKRLDQVRDRRNGRHQLPQNRAGVFLPKECLPLYHKAGGSQPVG